MGKQSIFTITQVQLCHGHESEKQRILPPFVWLEKNVPQQICTRCNDLVAMSYFAESGQGLAFLPDDQQRPGITKLFTFEPAKVSKLWLLTHPDLRNVERIKLVMRHLTTAFSDEWVRPTL